jgi:hypothetical protein
MLAAGTGHRERPGRVDAVVNRDNDCPGHADTVSDRDRGGRGHARHVGRARGVL